MSTDLMPASLQFKGEIMDFDLGMEIDHRKRRRNRTTQSCLNCHTSKRKCDRKRPCQRCIQLGLTGLCVYEVDDPALRDDPNIDETTRLRNRIAELESLVRELRGKPHPRWAEPNFCDGDATEKWHSRASRRTQLQIQRQRALESAQSSPVVKNEQSATSPHQGQLYRLSPSPGPTLSFDSSGGNGYRDSHGHHTHGSGSPSSAECGIPYASSSGSSSSTGYNTPNTAPGRNGPSGNVLAVSSADLYYHQPYIRNADGSAADPACVCLTNPAAGHPLIALSHQLQSTIDLLRQLPEHQARGGVCVILKHIQQLNDLMHGGSLDTTPSPSFDPLPTPESELMSPVSTSSHSSLGNAISHDWPAISASSTAQYDSYFPVAGDSGLYHKTYHLN